MKSISDADVGSCLGGGRSFARHEVVLAVLDERDFSRAHGCIEGFDRWSSFDEFVCERDGLHIGLSTAGLEVNLVDISMHDFRQWTVHSGITPSLQALDEFAAHVSLFRLNPGLPVESCPTDDWNDEGREIDSRGRSFRIPIAPVLYSDWLKSLESLELCFPNASIDLYAQFLMESWSSVS
jgi:hypothetical protein